MLFRHVPAGETRCTDHQTFFSTKFSSKTASRLKWHIHCYKITSRVAIFRMDGIHHFALISHHFALIFRILQRNCWKYCRASDAWREKMWNPRIRRRSCDLAEKENSHKIPSTEHVFFHTRKSYLV